ncbi:DNA-directed RNA polymerase [Sporobolomyces salmoneus]|uniref:DNA-directed RNA polymerase n=1 Tax=Sporobolomyces salmoneus TaxID=183962 RepID=UPI00317FA317
MLRTRLLRSNALTRLSSSSPRSILSSRLASSAAASHSPSHDLHRNRSPLYTVTPLPPIPPPLPADVAASQTSTLPASTSVPYNSTSDPDSALHSGITISHQLPAAQEQLAVLNACLSSGDIPRAEDVAKRIKANWSKLGEVGSLSTLLPCRVHADFLKAYLVRALQPFLQETSKKSHDSATTSEGGGGGRDKKKGASTPGYEGLGLPSLVDQRDLPMHSTLSMRSNALSSRNISKAWAYFDSLYGPQWDAYDPSTRKIKKGVNGAIDSGVFAAMFKGLVKLGSDVYNPSSLTDPDRVFRPITYLLPAMRRAKIDLETVMKDSIFDVDLPSYLGKLDRERVLDALQETGRGREGWDEWERIVDEVREVLNRMREGREKEEMEKPQLPELDPVMATGDQVNVSLQTLRTNLSTLAMPTSATSMTPTARQRLLEESSYDAARQLYLHEMESLQKVGKDKEIGMQSNWLQSLMYEWMRALERSLIEASDETGKSSRWGKDPDIEPFLRLLAPDKMALITIVELMRLCSGNGAGDGGMKAARAILHIGKSIENEYHAQVLKQGYTNKKFEKEMERLAEGGSGSLEGGGGRSPRESLGILWRRELAKREKEGDQSWRPQWTQSIRAKVGSILVTALMDVAKVERTAKHPRTGELVSEVQPAFSHAYQYVRGLKLGIIKVNPIVSERMDQDPLRVTLHPRYLPMVVKPKPWLTWNSGAYLVHNTQMVRTKDSEEQLRYLQQSSDADALDDVFNGLDALGSVPWKINREVFDVVTAVWNSGEAVADIPPKDSLLDPVQAEVPPDVDTDPRARDTYRHRLKTALQARRAAHSNRCDLNYKLEIARAFRDETFYFPHNLDFRGRAYPIPPNLSHIGDDMCRGLLLFGEEKTLGERGLRWLKIHLANLTGFDKASFDEREAYAMQHLEEIMDSADKPLEGNRWWLKADDPWQCLATCMELTKALRSSNPIEYKCALPIHQDGTCNGLQHYAALGGDLKGAHQVNLDVGTRPADVYTGVADMANKIIEVDAAKGVNEAMILKGKVTRKVVKQTVMTTVYGVTFIGAKNQIQRQLKDRGDVPAEHLYMCSLYLGRLVLDSIGDIFKGATGIQTWLNRCARLISKSIPPARIEAAMQAEKANPRVKRAVPTGLSRIPKEQMTSVAWTTPLGLPVVQPYRKAKKRQVSTTLQTIFITDPTIPSEVDPRAQATAFPPNFIHSLDATHMMMTALACKDKIAFASVHDSYWTHACDVDEMSVILRDTFIELHSQDILGKLRQEFITRYNGHVVPVAKLPAGLRSVEPGDPIPAPPSPTDLEESTTSTTASESSETRPDVSAVISELEEEDGSDSLSIFAQSKKVRRASSTMSTPWDDLESEDDDGGKGAVWKSTSKKTDSKLVYLADVLPPAPSKGDFDLGLVRNSPYFFN